MTLRYNSIIIINEGAECLYPHVTVCSHKMKFVTCLRGADLLTDVQLTVTVSSSLNLWATICFSLTHVVRTGQHLLNRLHVYSLCFSLFISNHLVSGFAHNHVKSGALCLFSSALSLFSSLTLHKNERYMKTNSEKNTDAWKPWNGNIVNSSCEHSCPTATVVYSVNLSKRVGPVYFFNVRANANKPISLLFPYRIWLENR